MQAALQRGWSIVYFPAVAIVHAGGRSSIHVYRNRSPRSTVAPLRCSASTPGGGLQVLSPFVYAALHLSLRLLLFIHRRVLTSTGAGRHGQADGSPSLRPGIAGWPRSAAARRRDSARSPKDSVTE